MTPARLATHIIASLAALQAYSQAAATSDNKARDVILPRVYNTVVECSAFHNQICAESNNHFTAEVNGTVCADHCYCLTSGEILCHDYHNCAGWEYQDVCNDECGCFPE